ncbi:hypothetical protein SARC_05105 [Sphaeroforma arctica JP610]|uniref:Uncharacterized protein n=1 Tax=Sphaeroforma arctica JP610 TaxID=667725 RepID=A0A0L0G367_9EUKA|nr:hypothetical protein SARC_05105 [Sphaeroforma arctica JP610]KNC82608.1 hypothetical protein SARC_05105 [Sphaeroforma arctica JP610]|eukprot:XP_014156510.1 hypothetical protein SARC_05105 [Sphaeroforma arctica JP610]
MEASPSASSTTRVERAPQTPAQTQGTMVTAWSVDRLQRPRNGQDVGCGLTAYWPHCWLRQVSESQTHNATELQTKAATQALLGGQAPARAQGPGTRDQGHESLTYNSKG